MYCRTTCWSSNPGSITRALVMVMLRMIVVSGAIFVKWRSIPAVHTGSHDVLWLTQLFWIIRGQYLFMLMPFFMTENVLVPKLQENLLGAILYNGRRLWTTLPWVKELEERACWKISPLVCWTTYVSQPLILSCWYIKKNDLELQFELYWKHTYSDHHLTTIFLACMGYDLFVWVT